MSSMREMNSEFMRLRWMAEEGEIDEEALQDTLEGMEDEWLEKMDAYVGVINLLRGTVAVYDEDIKKTKAKKEAIEKNIDRLKQFMFDSVKMRYPEGKPGTKKKYSYWTAKSQSALDTTNAVGIPDEYYVPQPAKLDSAKLLADVRAKAAAGEELPYGVQLKRSEYLTWR